MENTNNLNIAIIIEDRCFYNWQKVAVEQIQNLENAQLVVSIIKKEDKSTYKSPLFWKLFLKLDHKLFNPSPYALNIQKYVDAFPNLPSIDHSNSDINEQLKGYNLDVIIDLTDNRTSTELVAYSKHGIWFLSHCDLDEVNKRPYGIWEMITKKPKSVATLRYIKTGMEFPATIDVTSSCTDLLSFKRNINSLLWQAHFLLINNLKLLASDHQLFQNKIETFKSKFSNKAINTPYQPPKNGRILKYALSLYGNKLKQQIKSGFYFSQWAMIFFNSKDNGDPFDLKSYKQIIPPKDRFWADPFLIKENGKYYLFIEELIYKHGLGHLSVMEIDEDGNYTEPIKILEKDYHLSYPFVFQDNGAYYMIPETSGNKDIQLYKASNFPLEWELHQTLMTDIVAVDTTIYKEDNTYWMFTSQKNHKGASKNVELFLYSSKKLNSTNWKPHPLNPIVRNVATARPAGAIFKRDNKLYRSSQICSHHYGYGLNIIEITKLTETEYEERVELKVLPNWDKKINATHTFNNVDQLYISDIKLKRSSLF